MKKNIILLFCLVLALSITGCGIQTEKPLQTDAGSSEQTETFEHTVAIANPWQTFQTLSDAEHSAGIPFEIPETVADSYHVTAYRVLNGEDPILEVIYQDEDYEVVVRKAPGELRDISGVYGFAQTDTNNRNGAAIKTYRPSGESETPNAVLTTFYHDGYSWSFYAKNGYWGDSCEDFTTAVLGG